MPRQFVDYVSQVAHGDMGTSLVTGEATTDVIRARLSPTMQLAGLAFLVAMLVAVPLGVAMAALTYGGKRRSLEFGFAGTAGTFASIPSFLLAVALVWLFAVTFRVFPVAGREGVSSYVLPIAALAIAPAFALARIVRVEGLRVLDQDYMRTARGKRLPPRLFYVRHALPNTLTATLTIAGLLLGGLIAGTVLVENIFAWPGLGTVLVQSVTQKDYPQVQALALLFGTLVLVINFVVDIALGVIDPRSTILDA
jgi:peptide/nickel transport system permease protein